MAKFQFGQLLSTYLLIPTTVALVEIILCFSSPKSVLEQCFWHRRDAALHPRCGCLRAGHRDVQAACGSLLAESSLGLGRVAISCFTFLHRKKMEEGADGASREAGVSLTAASWGAGESGRVQRKTHNEDTRKWCPLGDSCPSSNNRSDQHWADFSNEWNDPYRQHVPYKVLWDLFNWNVLQPYKVQF